MSKTEGGAVHSSLLLDQFTFYDQEMQKTNRMIEKKKSFIFLSRYIQMSTACLFLASSGWTIIKVTLTRVCIGTANTHEVT